jgi:hypothetical protein
MTYDSEPSASVLARGIRFTATHRGVRIEARTLPEFMAAKASVEASWKVQRANRRMIDAMVKKRGGKGLAGTIYAGQSQAALEAQRLASSRHAHQCVS